MGRWRSKKSMVVQMASYLFNFICFSLLLLLQRSCASTMLASFTSEVGGGNYTYYSLTEQGDITIILVSLFGDADVYVAQHSQPTSLNYQLSSTTYGSDVVTVTSDISRPCGVGVHGHIHKPLSRYRLVALLNYTGEYDDALRDSVSAAELFAGVGEGGGIAGRSGGG